MSIAELPAELVEPFRLLSKDLRDASVALRREDGRFLVDLYYTVQDARIRAKHQWRTSREAGEPNRLIDWAFEAQRVFETTLKGALGRFARSYRVGQWMQAQCGVGPVLSAAMLVHLDIRRAPAAGNFWSFAGLVPGKTWSKGQKRPWNAELKAICAFRLGECFVKTCNRPQSVYGALYAAKKAELAEKNAAGGFGDRAGAEIARVEENPRLAKKMQETGRWKHWQEGHLCPQHVHDQARRWAVKLFLSHLHQVMYEDYYGTPAPKPYCFREECPQQHVHLIEVPLWPEAYKGRNLRDLLGDE